MPERDAVDEALAQWARERPDLDPSGLAVVLRVQRLAGDYGERLKAILAPRDLAPWEFEVLSALRRTGAALSPKELCAAAQLTSGAMTHRLDRLEGRWLVRRRPDKEDRRGVRVSLTARGRALVDGVMKKRMEDAAESLAGLTKAERRTLARLLRALG